MLKYSCTLGIEKMAKNKLKKLQNQIETKIGDTVSSINVNFIGQAFYGHKNISKKDRSYTATLWHVFCYMPLLPIDSFRLTNPDQIPKRLFPKVFAHDEFIYYDTAKIDLDWLQVIWTLLLMWTPFVASIVLIAAFPLPALIVIIISSLGIIGYEILIRHNIHPNFKFLTKFKFTPRPRTTLPPSQKSETPVGLRAEDKLVGSTRQASENYVPHLWDELFVTGVIRSKEKPIELKRPNYFLETIGYLVFISFPVYFFLYVYLNTAIIKDSTYISLTNIYNYLNTGHLFVVITAAVGVVVFIKNKALGFLLILFAILIYFNLHQVLWNYLNSPVPR
jgi:hypothetical protein